MIIELKQVEDKSFRLIVNHSTFRGYLEAFFDTEEEGLDALRDILSRTYA